MHRFLAALTLLFFSFTAEAQRLPLENSKYDEHFKEYSSMYMPGRDWRLLKAQCYQESLFDPNAKSYVGAAGLCQFMPATWKETENLIKQKGSAYDSELSIMFAAHYMNRMRWFFRSEAFIENRESLAIASYNAGAGHILKAKRSCPANSDWKPILHECLPKITGKHAKETQTYVSRIWVFFDRLKKLG
jgi:membrane-bound lytic murein transglycosylase F